MSKLQALREKKRDLAASIRQVADKLNAEGYTPTAEDEANWKTVNDDYNANSRALEREETATAVLEASDRNNQRIAPQVIDDSRARGVSNRVASDADRTTALSAWCRAQFDIDPTEDDLAACNAVGMNPRKKEIALSLMSTHEARALQNRYRSAAINPFNRQEASDNALAGFQATLSTGSGPAGGYLIAPEQLRTSLEVNMLAFGGVRQVAEMIRTATGEPLSWPTADDTSNAGVQLGESTSIGSSVDPTFGKILWSAYKFSSKAILVPYELLQDAAFNLPALIGQMLGERLGRITNTKFTTGTGAATPKGIVTAATSFSAGSASAITFDDIMGLEHAIDPTYRGGAGYMAHDSIMLVIRKLKDGQGQPIWQSNWQSGMPDRLNGYPIALNQDMDSTVSSGKKTILFGQLSKYKIRTVGDMRMYRLEERYRDTDQDGFVAFIREDGNLLTAGTAPVKYLAH